MNSEQLLINDLYRLDGRLKTEIRDINIKLNQVKNSSGSCELTQGNTKVIAWVNGPREGRTKNFELKGTIKCTYATAPFSSMTRKSEYKRDLQMREFSNTLKDIFEDVISLSHYIKSEIELNVLVLESDGSAKSCSITALTLALINAGIMLKETVVGVSVGILESENTCLVDLTKEEEKNKIPIINCCYMKNTKRFLFLEMMNSQTKYSKADDLIKNAEKGGEEVYNVVQSFLKEEYLNFQK